jgi:hypothetical protein
MSHSLKEITKQTLFNTIAKNRALLFHEADKIDNFMKLLMKHRNTRYPWTNEERKILRAHLWYLSSYIPALIIFCLPGGSLLFPVLAEILDRRKNKRASAEQDAKEKDNNHLAS